MEIRKAILKGFNAGSYTATVQISGSNTAYLESVAVARNIPQAEMVSGRFLAVLFGDAHNPAETVIIAVYT